MSAVPRPARRAAEHGNDGHARDGEDRRDEPQRRRGLLRACATIQREHEVERRAAALAEHGAEHAVERLPADEERERLVLVRRPGRERHEKERGDAGRARRNAERERTAPESSRRPRVSCERPRARQRLARSLPPHRGANTRGGLPLEPLLALSTMPIYEYRCPEGPRVRALPAHGRPAAEGVRGLWRGARSSGCSTRCRSSSRARASTRPTTASGSRKRESSRRRRRRSPDGRRAREAGRSEAGRERARRRAEQALEPVG